MRMPKPIAALALLVFAVPAFASDLRPGMKLGTSAHQIAEALDRLGYEMTEFELDDDDEIEVEARRGSEEYELEIDRRNGEIVDVDRD